MDEYQITFNTWDGLAQWYEDTFMQLDIYNHTYKAFCDRLQSEDAEILELGCGPGNVTKQLLFLKPKLKILATDISHNMLAFAKRNNPQALYQILDARKISTIQKTFDAILAGFCLPYLSKDDCKLLIKNAAAMLNENGIMYISCIEGDYTKSGMYTNGKGQQSLVFYYEYDFLKLQLQNNGFEDLQIFRVPYPSKDNQTATHLIVIAKKS